MLLGATCQYGIARALTNKTHSVPERIVSIHQPHVRPIVSGKEKAKVEFGSKINVNIVDGYAFLDHLAW
jgi:IS5 family transposase